ncbi:SGNH/GDSL hydrolase family protein [Sabulilitoribacter arenilitoris]|uniref:SGNH/GDSL hydrolase family protein n=1 Tax=Wocania arenilitoris TaxID=2044858 RepID=A0AAE3EQG2_9FLAO|nr:SGNH/GDSL hydrolase family protein [Wocania arenilitoris]MCF7569112.1 SGNH/GDSL hydrolase family protein [Wocania arenilitoris]
MYIIRFQYLLVFLFVSHSFLCLSQDESNIVYYGKDYFILEGTEIDESLKENPYDRLPLSYKNVVRKPVWELSKNSSGMSIRFFSNSTSIHAKWTLLNDLSMNHMADTGVKGIDLYFNNNGTWQYLNTARPNGKENVFELMNSMSPKMREYKMFLPLYDGVKSLEVGIDCNSVIKKPKKNTSKSIVFYGTSITQGCCASRPGMAHTNIISRKLNIDCINFGFSGNGRMEEPINELISESNPLFYVIECLPNMKEEEVATKAIPLVNTIRKKHPETPIIFVENFIYETVALNEKKAVEINVKNKALKDQYTKLIDNNVKNVFYISAEKATGIDHEGTVDGVHFTDLGFIRYANFLIDRFEKLDLLPKQSR